MNEKLIDLYIQKIITEVTELTKTKLLLETKLQFQEQMNLDLMNRIKELEVQVEVKEFDESEKTF